ncbi:hypothetical protein GQ53DRAFT_856468 [Thozetella sp. PMI_491]|nr:hypothetical protein GQ53DRAFT_856468 [Thozetella sp. PMI_491]
MSELASGTQSEATLESESEATTLTTQAESVLEPRPQSSLETTSQAPEVSESRMTPLVPPEPAPESTSETESASPIAVLNAPGSEDPTPDRLGSVRPDEIKNPIVVDTHELYDISPVATPPVVLNPSYLGDGRVREFLESRQVAKLPGLDWLSTLISFASTSKERLEEAQAQVLSLKEKEKDLAAAQSDLVSLRAALSGTETRVRSLEATESELSITKKQLESLQKELQELNDIKRKVAELHVENQDLDSRKREAERSVWQKDQSLTVLGNEVIALRKKNDDLSAQVSIEHSTLMETKGAYNQVAHEAGTLREDLKQRASELGRTSKELAQTVQVMEGYRIQIEDLKKDLSNVLVDKKALESQLKRAATETKRKLEELRETHNKDLQIHHSEHSRDREEISRLVASIETLNRQLQQEKTNNNLLINDMDKAHKEEMAQIDAAYREDVAQMDRMHKAKIDQMDRDHREIVAALNESIDFKIDEATRNNQTTIVQQKNQIASFRSGDYRPIDDEVLKASFNELLQDLIQLADKIPQPPTGTVVGREFDEAHYLSRNNNQGPRVWSKFVRNLCWRVMLSGFFSLPMGFGVFGSGGPGHAHLGWVHQLIATRNQNGDSTIPNDMKTNVIRASVFEMILAAVKAKNVPRSQFANLFYENIAQVTKGLVETLTRVSRKKLDESCMDQCKRICDKLAIFTLEMASQRAHVTLDMCGYESCVSPQRYKVEGTLLPADVVVVDLMIEPCLVRAGNGIIDLKSENVIVKGDVVALSTR